MSDVLFDTGSSTLKAGAREKLAKISGILLAYPGLTRKSKATPTASLDAFIISSSPNGAPTVWRDFLAEQGVAPSSMTAHGFGKTAARASNDNAEGRQRNRRVELVVNATPSGKSASVAAATQPINFFNPVEILTRKRILFAFFAHQCRAQMRFATFFACHPWPAGPGGLCLICWVCPHSRSATNTAIV